MLRRLAAGALLTVAVAAIATSYSTWQARRLVTDPEPMTSAVGAVLEEPRVRHEMAERITEAIFAQLTSSSPGQLEALLGFDPEPHVHAVAVMALDDPAFEEAMRDELRELHGVLFYEQPGPLAIDAGAMTEAVRRSAARLSPPIAALIPPASITVRVPIDQFPDLSGLRRGTDRIFAPSLAIAIIAFAAALSMHPRRHKVLRTVGVWAVFVGATHLLVSSLLASAVGFVVDEPDDVGIGERVAGSLGDVLRPGAIALIVTGVALLLASVAWQWVGAGRSSPGEPLIDPVPVARPQWSPYAVTAEQPVVAAAQLPIGADPTPGPSVFS